MAIYDINNTIITKLVQSALSHPDVIEIKNRTLDGQWHIQSIGSGATVLDVSAHFTINEKDVFDNVKKNTSSIKVVFDSRYYIGIIDGDINYTRVASDTKPMFTATFTLLVQNEGVV